VTPTRPNGLVGVCRIDFRTPRLDQIPFFRRRGVGGAINEAMNPKVGLGNCIISGYVEFVFKEEHSASTLRDIVEGVMNVISVVRRCFFLFELWKRRDVIDVGFCSFRIAGERVLNMWGPTQNAVIVFD